MGGEKILAPLPTCEVCWLKAHTQWEPESCDDDGNIIMRLKGVDIPQKYNTHTVEVCSQCGNITISGIYELRDPDEDQYTNQKISSLSKNTEAHFELEDSEEEEP